MTPAQLALLLEVAEAIRELMKVLEWECAATPALIGELMEIAALDGDAALTEAANGARG